MSIELSNSRHLQTDGRIRRPHCGSGSQSASRLSRAGNTIKTDRYDIVVDKDKVRIFDRETNTWAEAWGDPHLHTSDGDKAQFHTDNLTIDLPDGTKVTLKPTAKDANGVSWIDEVAVMKGDEAYVVRDVHGSPRFGELQGAAEVDAMHADGTVLRAGNEVDDLFFTGAAGKELVGGDASQRFGEHMLDGKGGVSQYDFEGLAKSYESGDLDGAGFYEILMAVLADVQNDLSDGVKEMRDLHDQRKKAKESGGDTDFLDHAIERLQFRLQEVMSRKTQVSQMLTQLMSTDHQAKMAIIRNIKN